MNFNKVSKILVALMILIAISAIALASTGSGVEPVLLTLTVGDAESEISQAMVGKSFTADFAYKVNNAAENGVYIPGDGNTITIINSDGYTFDWKSEWPVTCILVKAGKNYYNAYYYPEGAYEDTGLSAPINPVNGNKFQISHVTFGYNEPQVSYKHETAWAKGTRYVSKGNWAMYVEYNGEEKTVELIAGCGNSSGTIVGTATISEPNNGYVTITINLTGGAKFYYDVNDPKYDNNLKVQDYSIAPNRNPAPGLFSYKKFVTPNTTSTTIVVPVNNYYGIHLDVAVPVIN